MQEHTGEHGGQPAGRDEGLLGEIHRASGDLWRRVRGRAVERSIVCLAGTQAILWLGLWLLPGEVLSGGFRESAAWAAGGILALIALGSGVTLAVIDSLQALVAEGPLLARLGTLLRPLEPGQRAANPEEQFAAFGSPQALSRAARILDLPLIVFLARAVLGVEVKRLLTLAQGGADRETVLREFVRMAQARAAASLHRAKLIVWSALGLVAVLISVMVWLLTR